MRTPGVPATRRSSRMTHQKKQMIPAFHAREEEAAFWDTHDFTEEQETFRPVKIRFTKRLGMKKARETRPQKATIGQGVRELVRIGQKLQVEGPRNLSKHIDDYLAED